MSLSLKESLAPFFGGDEKCLAFFEALSPSISRNEAPNTEENASAIQGSHLWEMMLAKNYNQKPRNMGDDDIHHQFVDFIVRTALFHKEIDRPTKLGSIGETARKIVRQNIQRIFNSNVLATDGLFTPMGVNRQQKIAHLENLARQVVIQNEAQVGAQPPRNNLTIGDLVPDQKNMSYYQLLMAILFLTTSVYAAPNQNPNIETDTDEFRRISVRHIVSVGNNYDISRINNSIDAGLFYQIYGNCTSPDQFLLGSLCNVIFNEDNGSFMDELYNSLARNMQSEPKNIIDGRIKAEVALSVFKILSQQVSNMSTNFDRESGAGVGDIKESWLQYYRDGNKSRLVNHYNNAVNNMSVKSHFETALVNALVNAVKGRLNVAESSPVTQRGVRPMDQPHTRISDNKYASVVCERIIARWGDLDNVARDFYRNQLAVLKKSVGSRSSEEGRWSIVDEIRYPSVSCDECGKCKNVRINLMKVSEGSNEMMFEHILPFIPVEKVNKIWFTDNTGNLRFVKAKDVKPSILKDIYRCVYFHEDVQTLFRVGCSIGDVQLNFPGDFSAEAVFENSHDWNFNLKGIVKTLIKEHKAPRVSDLKLEHIFDHDTKMIWFRDANGLYKIDPVTKKKVHNNEIMSDPEFNADCGNTMGLNVHEQDVAGQQHCSDIATCVLKSPENLTSCIEYLKNRDMFDVAQEELSKVLPPVAVRLLDVFQVPRVNMNHPLYGNIKRPVTYDHWEREVLYASPEKLPKSWSKNHKFVEVLKKNDKLLNYIKGIIAYVTANPAILNEHVTQDINIGSVENEDDIALGLHYYVTPNSTSQIDDLRWNTNVIVNDQMSLINRNRPIHSFISPISNALYGDMSMSNETFNMSGGGLPSSRKHLDDMENTLGSLMAELKADGLEIHQRDVAKIGQTISEMKTVEKKVYELIKTLQVLHNLQKFVKCFTPNHLYDNRGDRVLRLENVVNNRDLLRYINEQIGDYENCINSSINFINGNTRDLLLGYKDLIDVISS